MDLDEAECLFALGPEGVEEWNRRREVGEPIPDLTEADFWGTELNGIDLSDARLHGACMSEGGFERAVFRRAILYEANLASANCRNACFQAADLRCAEFGVFSIGLGHSGSQADVSGADFSFCQASEADFTETIIGRAIFLNADLTNADFRHSDSAFADFRGATTEGVIWSDPDPGPSLPEVTFGEWLRQQRHARGLTQVQLAEQIGLGLCHLDVKHLEKKSYCESIQIVNKLVELFSIPRSEVPRTRPC